MSTLQHKQVKSQKQHLKILGAGGPRGRGPRADIWGRGPRKTNTRNYADDNNLSFWRGQRTHKIHAFVRLYDSGGLVF